MVNLETGSSRRPTERSFDPRNLHLEEELGDLDGVDLGAALAAQTGFGGVVDVEGVLESLEVGFCKGRCGFEEAEGEGEGALA